ncbi:Alpha/beta hydrolase family protein [Candidatus Izimaplasma bacterium HR1]|jgi:cephalosporin-C deacetylase-like acetyl esterase|uniref:alpha/beta hydrolase n=1 Tax=Candidatus Izimoplasma sp. HR1 TaxID=1541959 RepID=UPI0004F7BEB4|nr:Alpha/beta hydrolase family protein [Candidatus Izimaplasma bacterium HR1]
MYKQIEFPSLGVTLRGRLYIPDKYSRQHSIIIMAHGFTTTISGMTADRYAEKFHEAGFAVLLYDHCNFGMSDGHPRQELCFWIQARGYIDAIDFVSTIPTICKDNIVVWGASLSSRESFIVGVIDDRVKAIINLVPAYGDDFPIVISNEDAYSFAKKTILNNDIYKLPHTVSKPIPIVSSDQLGSPSALIEISAYRWFIEYGGRYGTNWKNYVSFLSIKQPENFHIGCLAVLIKAPVLMVIADNDEMSGASSDVAIKIYDTIDSQKKKVMINGGHFGLLHYPSTLFNQVSEIQIDFLKEHLRT